MSTTPTPGVELVPVEGLVHIEGYSTRRVGWLFDKITREALWTKPLALDEAHGLVLDGQHRMEVAKKLGLRRVPAVRYRYADVEVWSLRAGHVFDWRVVTERALAKAPYPYKTVKHRFPVPLPACAISVDELRR